MIRKSGSFDLLKILLKLIKIYFKAFVEALNSEVLWSGIGKKIIPITLIEEALIENVPIYMEVYNKLNIDPPIFIFVTLIDLKDYKIPKNRLWGPSNPYTIDRDIVLIPELIIENKEFEPSRTLKPIFDSIWNKYGYKGSFNYTKEGEKILI